MAGKVISIEIGYSLTRVCEVDYKSKTHKVYGYFSLPTPEGMINDGILNFNETFVADLREALAEYKMKSKQVVFTLKDGKAQWNYVQTGLENAESYSMADDALKEGDTVIVTGNVNLAHEAPVKVVDR